MVSRRIQCLASLVENEEKVVDIGTDHALLPIYLYQNNITHNIIASDISNNVLESAYQNLVKYGLTNKIRIIQSDGFDNIKEDYDLAIIAGMGTITIINILKRAKLPKKLIIQSNNNHALLRRFMQRIGYKIETEIVLLEKNIYYVIIKYILGQENMSNDELDFGKSNNLDYFKYLLDRYQSIYNKNRSEILLDKINRLKLIIEKRLD